ncbi:MAG: cytochrome c5 family protein, partial [Patescibacteria group bacterium]|nr:cytochrome c5 family protein [Patescibacteria group bacterium]
MKTFASFAVLLSMVVVLSGCGSKEAPEPSGDAPDVHVPAEPSAVPPPAAPTFDDESDPVPGPAPVAPA